MGKLFLSSNLRRQRKTAPLRFFALIAHTIVLKRRAHNLEEWVSTSTRLEPGEVLSTTPTESGGTPSCLIDKANRLCSLPNFDSAKYCKQRIYGSKY
jgi:hypothetical protein